MKDKNLKNEKEEIKDNKESEEAKVEQEETQQSEENEITKLEAKCNEYLDKYQRSLAEFDNFRKRTSKEKASMYDDGVRDTIEKLLPVVDNLERAMAAQEKSTDAQDAFYKGIKMILKQLQETLKALGVEEIKAVGEVFDPNLHSAIAHEDDEQYGANEVINEMLKGYKYKDKVIRHSMVKVAN